MLLSSPPGFQWCSCYSIFSFVCNVLQIVVCYFVLFLLSIVFSVLRFLDSDYPLVFSNYSYSWHKRKLFASMKSSGLLIRNMLQSESWELTDVISLNAVIHRIKKENNIQHFPLESLHDFIVICRFTPTSDDDSLLGNS